MMAVEWRAELPATQTGKVTAITAGIIAIGSLVYYVLRPRSRVSELNSYPFIFGVPFFGRVYDFVTRPIEFITNAERSHGNLFGFTLMGKNAVMLTNLEDFFRVWKTSDKFLTSADNAFKNVMNLTRDRYNWFMATGCNKIIHHCLVQGLSGSKLALLNVRISKYLESKLILHDLGERKLYDWTSKLLYEVIMTSMGGKHFHAEERYEDYVAMDAGFHLIVSGFSLPFSSVLSKARVAQRRLGASMVACIGEEDAACIIEDLAKQFKIMQLDVGEQELLFGAFTWASHANTSSVVFWLLVHLMKNPEGMEGVRAELDSHATVHPDWWKDTERIAAHLNDLVKLKSAMKETLRILTATLGSRDCVQGFELALTDGRILRLERGDRVLMYPAWHHYNEVFTDANKFQYDRFLNSEDIFRSAGIVLKEPVSAFGGGATKCPGHLVAQSEILLFTAILLTRFNIELVNKSEAVPPYNLLKFGLGSFAPAHDIDFSLSARSAVAIPSV